MLLYTTCKLTIPYFAVFLSPISRHILGETTTVSGSSNAVVFIEGTAHCADLYPPRATDLPGLTYARQVQQQFISQWLAQDNNPAVVLAQS